MGLPLLRLPNLVITNIVDITRIDDLTCLLLCSKRARNLLIVCRRQNQFKEQYIRATVITDRTSVDVVTLPVIEVIQISNLESYLQTGCSKDCQLFSNRTVASVTDEIGKLETVEIEGHRVPFFRYSEVLLTFWESEAIGLRKCMDFARETFGIPIKHLVFSQKGMWAFDWINGWEEKIQQMTVLVNGIQDHELKYVMEKCESRMLKTCGEYQWSKGPNMKRYPSGSFQFDLHELKAKFLYASACRWITVPNIAASFLEALVIEESKLTNRDLNLFLRLWLVGGFPCLRYIYLNISESIQMETATNGIENDLRKTSYQHKFSKEGLEDEPHVQYDLQQRGNGYKRASIRFYTYMNSLLMSVWN
ncbi:unnamed protein product [Caenorhabditis brenneri]